MKLPIVDETQLEALDLPGRHLSWLMPHGNATPNQCSVCVIHVAPGNTVRPAHSHPNGEEVIYIIQGSGQVMIEGIVESVHEGCAVLFERGKIHMLRNTGKIEMKVVCFFAPPTDLANYKCFEDIDFPCQP